MAQNGKVNPDCSSPANPNECTETCSREAPPQKNKKSSGVVPLKFGWKKNRGSNPEPSPVRDRIPASKVRASSHSGKKKLETETNEHVSFEAVSTEKHIQDLMDSDEAYIAYLRDSGLYLGCLGDSNLNVVFCLGIFIYLAATQEISLPVAGFLILVSFIFCILCYVYDRPAAAIPRPNTGAANAATATVGAITDASFQNNKDDCEA